MKLYSARNGQEGPPLHCQFLGAIPSIPVSGSETLGGEVLSAEGAEEAADGVSLEDPSKILFSCGPDPGEGRGKPIPLSRHVSSKL